MIKSKSQSWEPGKTVKIGNIELIVETKIPTPGDGKPDKYELRSLDGLTNYLFQPFNGLKVIEPPSVAELLETDELNRNEIIQTNLRRHGR